MTAKFKSKKFRSALQKASKAVLFCLLFAVIFSYTRNVLRNKSESEALGVIMSQSDRSYDVILCGPSHMQYSLQPAQLYGEYGIVSCNTSTAAQSIPTTYYVIKEMLEQHTPKLVVVDLFCLFYPENFFTPTRFHQAVDNFPLGKVKTEAILGLADESKSEFFIDYLLYHGRWKELTEYDYTVLSEYNETYQLLCGTYPYPEPFEPIFDETAEIPEIPLKYLEKIADLCRKNNVSLMFTVIPYRADVDNNDTSAELQQKSSAPNGTSIISTDFITLTKSDLISRRIWLSTATSTLRVLQSLRRFTEICCPKNTVCPTGVPTRITIS